MFLMNLKAICMKTLIQLRIIRGSECEIFMNKFRILSILTVILGLGVISIQSSTPACAQRFAPDSCDPQYYESLESRAWMEAQREITQNQNLIFKADSVLEYTCFDRSLNYIAGAIQTQPMFSMSPRWGGPAGDIGAALDPIAGTAAAYDVANFNHDLLGGRKLDDEYEIADEVSPSMNYSCNTMNRVWEVSRCMNLVDNAAEDGFFDFANYWGNPDKRFLPERCPAIAPPLFEEENALATADDETPWEEDQVLTYFNLVYPQGGGCGGAESALQTGLTVTRSTEDPKIYPEFICVVPGCFYSPQGTPGQAAGCILGVSPG